jgi:UDP-sugar pyrophosphorylase
LTVKGLEVDGALVIRCGEESHVTVDGLVVNNKGFELKELDPDQEYPEHVRIRGYAMSKNAVQEYIISEPGNFVIDASGEVKEV